MAASKQTLRAAAIAHDNFSDNEFTEAEYNKLHLGIRIQTLVKHDLVKAQPKETVIETWTPQEFCDYVQDELLGADLWDYNPDIRWNQAQQQYEMIEHSHTYRFV